MDGVVSVVELGAVGKERTARLVTAMKGPEKARCIQWRPSKFELITSHETGLVIVWQLQTSSISCKCST